MIVGEVSGGDFSGILGMLRSLAAPDLKPLGERIKVALVEGNRSGLLAGLDADGNPMAPLAESTIKRGRGGDGPPTVPESSSAALIERYQVGIDPMAGGGIRIRAGWSGIPQLDLLQSGTRHMPARRVIGVRPQTRLAIQAEVDAFASTLIGGRGRFGSLSGFGLL